MNKPIKPKKIIEVRHTASFDFNWVSKKVSLKVFQDWIKNTVPHNAIYKMSYQEFIDWIKKIYTKYIERT